MSMKHLLYRMKVSKRKNHHGVRELDLEARHFEKTGLRAEDIIPKEKKMH